jgi:hypothetical protein
MRLINDAVRTTLLGAAAVTGAACGEDDSTGETGSIQVAVTPSTLSIPQGGSGSVTVQLTRVGGFTGSVTLSVSGLPTGVTTTITPPELTGSIGSATITVGVAQTVAAGNHTASVTATAPGVGQATATYQLTVTQPAPVDVEYRFCHADAPSLLAWQDGSGTWQLLDGTESGDTTRYGFTVTQGRGGVMFLYHDAAEPAEARRLAQRSMSLRRAAVRARIPRPQGRSVRSSLVDQYDTRLVYASAAELAGDGEATCENGAVPTKTVTGTVTNVPEGSYGIVSLGSPNVIFDGAASTNPITFIGVEDGPVDLIGTRTRPGTVPDAVLVLRNLDVPDGGPLPAPIDFGGTGTWPPATATATVTGGGGHDLEIFVTVVTPKSEGGLWFELASTPSSSRIWAGLGSDVRTATDLHGLIVFASPPGHPGDVRVAGKYVGPVSNQTLALGPTIELPTTSLVDPGPYPRFRFQGMLPPDYNKSLFLDLVSAGESGNAYGVIMTSAWLSASGTSLSYDFTMPDLTTLPGFPVDSRLTFGANELIVDALGFVGDGVFELRPSMGTEFRGSIRFSTVTVP